MTQRFLAVVMVIQMIAYLFYDVSYYHIDTVREPMIRFLYFEAMLLGVHFRESAETYKEKKAGISFLVTLILFGAYFSSKLLFVRYEEWSRFQIVNQWVLLALLYFIWRSFAAVGDRMEIFLFHRKDLVSLKWKSMDFPMKQKIDAQLTERKLAVNGTVRARNKSCTIQDIGSRGVRSALLFLSGRFRRGIKMIIAGIAQITLEIYLVQNAIISNIPQGIRFPLNWFVVTGTILIAAVLLHWAVLFLTKGIDKIWAKGKSLK